MRSHALPADGPPKRIEFSTLVRMSVYLRRYPWFALGTFGCAILTTLAGLIFPSATGQAIDRILKTGTPSSLWPYVLTVAASFLARDGFNGLRIWLNNAFEQKVILDLRCDLYAALQKLPLRWYDNRATGDLMTRVSEDVGSVERVLIDGIEQGLVAILQILGVGIYLFALNARLAAWTLLPIPFLVAGAVWYTSTAHHRYRIQRRATSAMNALLLDNLQGVRQIKSYAQEDAQAEHFASKAEAVHQGNLVVMKAWSIYSPSMAFFGSLGAVIVLFIGGQDAMANPAFTAGQLVTFLLFVGMFYEPVGRLHQLNQMMQAARAAGERVFEIIDEPAEAYAGTDRPTYQATPSTKTRGEVHYDHVGFEYRKDLPILHNIEFTAKPGQRVALVGPTGAGKTTFVNLLPRFYEATSGRITIDGVDVRDLPLATLREKIGVVSQESFMFNASVRDNLRFGRPDATDSQIEHALRAAHAWGFVEAMPEKLETIVGERGVKLSVGEKQRLSIARAILKDPPILILDEATASVDTETEKLIQNALERLLENRTSFIIAHRLSTVRTADVILVLQKGHIIERGTHAELLENQGLYAKLCQAQAPELLTEREFERALVS